MSYTTIEAIEKRRRAIRIVLFIIVLGTLPFYCAGFILWGTAKPRGAQSEPLNATNTPIGINLTATNTLFPTVLPFVGNGTPISPLQPTPLQFIPPGGGSGGGSGGGGVFIPPTATFFVPPPVIPVDTLAPTLTPFPTNPPPPTAAPPTQTPLPTDAPLPTEAPTAEPPTAEAPTAGP